VIIYNCSTNNNYYELFYVRKTFGCNLNPLLCPDTPMRVGLAVISQYTCTYAHTDSNYAYMLYNATPSSSSPNDRQHPYPRRTESIRGVLEDQTLAERDSLDLKKNHEKNTLYTVTGSDHDQVIPLD
jgi:hypothetical protein